MLVTEKQEYIQEIEKMRKINEELAKQLNELTRQLQYKDMYENEQKRRIKVEDQLREADKEKLEKYMQDIDAIKLLLEKEQEISWACKNQTSEESLSALESKQMIKDSEEFNTKDDMYEKRISKIIGGFDRQLKYSEGVHRKDLHNLQAKIEELKREEAKKFEDNEKAHRQELYDLHLKIKELEGKKFEDSSEEVHRKELNNLQVKCKIEGLKREIDKTIKDSEEVNRKNMLEKEHLKEQIEMLKEEIAQLKHKLHENQATEQAFIEKLNKELNARDEKHEKQMNKVIDSFNKQLKDSEEVHRKELDNLKADIEEFKRKKLIRKPRDGWFSMPPPDFVLSSPDITRPPHHVAEVKPPVAKRVNTSQVINTQSSNHANEHLQQIRAQVHSAILKHYSNIAPTSEGTSSDSDVANGAVTKKKLSSSTKESHLTTHKVYQTCEKLSVSTTLLWSAHNTKQT